MIEPCLREMSPQDDSFVRHSWLSSFRPKEIPGKLYRSYQRRVIGKLLDNAAVVIACNPDCIDQIFGYMVYRQEPLPILHYCYVKHVFRQRGIASAMLRETFEPDEVIMVTHNTRCIPFLKSKRELIYNPYLLYGVFT